ncbi:MAG: hypothetical protein AB7T49_13340 [Oligoflexales bacterium]
MRKGSIISFLLLMVAILSGCGGAASKTSNDFSDVIIEIREVPAVAHRRGLVRLACSNKPAGGFGDVDIGKIVNYGKKIWQIILENRPVTNLCFDYANAFPKGVAKPADLSGFSQLHYKTYNYTAKNVFGGVLADVTYSVVHQFGGSYDGKGKFLATVSIVPGNVSVAIGNRLDFDTTKIVVTNVGTDAEPVASIVMETQLRLSNPFDTVHKTQIFQVSGNSPEVVASMP